MSIYIISFQEVYRFDPKLVDEFDSDPKVASFFVKRLFDWRKIDRFLGYMPKIRNFHPHPKLGERSFHSLFFGCGRKAALTSICWFGILAPLSIRPKSFSSLFPFGSYFVFR